MSRATSSRATSSRAADGAPSASTRAPGPRLYRYTLRRAIVAGAPSPCGVDLQDSHDVARLIEPVFRDLGDSREHFVALYIDVRNRIIGLECIATGSATSVEVHPREVFHGAIVAGAAGVIVSHNHPSGDPTPSPEDLALTRRLKDVGAIVGIPLIDHVIVADRGHRSLAAWMARGGS